MAMFLKTNVEWLRGYHERHPVFCLHCESDKPLRLTVSITHDTMGEVSLTCPACGRLHSRVGRDLAEMYQRVRTLSQFLKPKKAS